MSRLIAFGCSHTYGHGLPDCFIPPHRPGTDPSKLSWPYPLGELLNSTETITSVKTCLPGASNIEILYKVINFNFQPDDVIVVMWSHTFRDTIFDCNDILLYEDKNYSRRIGTTVGPWLKEELSENWAKVHSTFDCIMRSWINIQHADLFLKSKGLECYHYLIEDKFMNQFKNIPLIENVKKITIRNNFWDLLSSKEKSLDGIHGGVEFNKCVAQVMYNDIIELKEQSKYEKMSS